MCNDIFMLQGTSCMRRLSQTILSYVFLHVRTQSIFQQRYNEFLCGVISSRAYRLCFKTMTCIIFPINSLTVHLALICKINDLHHNEFNMLIYENISV